MSQLTLPLTRFRTAELEHCILRAGMNAPVNLHNKFSLPKSTFACAISRRDWRLNFVLSSGSVSVPAGVPIYVPAELHKQLDLATTHFLSQFVQVASIPLPCTYPLMMVFPRVPSYLHLLSRSPQLLSSQPFFLVQVQTLSNRSGVIVVLPKVMQWYQRDFGRGSPFDCVRAAALYLPERQVKILEPALSVGLDGAEPLSLTVNYATYEFSCAILRPIDLNLTGFLPESYEGPGGGASFD